MCAVPEYIPKICRLCANFMADTEHSISLFDKSNKAVVKQIKELTGLQLKDVPKRRLPRFLCTKCKKNLPRACAFRQKIIATQNYFNSENFINKLEAKREDPKPMFDFIPFNEYDNGAATESTFSDDSNKAVNDNQSVKCVETNIKEETKEINTQSSKEINIYKNSHKKTLKADDGEREVYKQKGDENLIEKHSDSKNNFSVNNFSDDSSTTHTENLEQLYESDLFNINYDKRSAIENASSSRNKEEPQDILQNKKISCHLCPRSLENLICLRMHFQKQHKGEKFKCDLCIEKFSTIKSLVRHFRLHQGEKEFKCHYCDMSFKYSTIRCRHERRMHSKDPPFLCFICGKTFITSTMGRDHMTVHTKERAFHCTVCKADFLRKSHLNTHYRSMTHKNNQQKLNDEMFVGNESSSRHCPDAQGQLELSI